MKLSLLLVNYHTESHIMNLLHDVARQSLTPDAFEIIIVDNSQSNTLKTQLGDTNLSFLNLHIVYSVENIGFGRAMNLAASRASGEYLLIINPDIRLHDANVLTQLLTKAETKGHFGVASCCILNDNDEDVSTYYHYEFNDALGYDGQICWFQGSFLYLRRSVFMDLGGFDADFFMYCEDVDLCFRIKKAGLPLIKFDDLSVRHLGGASEPFKNYDFYHRWYRSRFLFAKKHFDDKKFKDLINKTYRKSIKRIVIYRAKNLFGLISDYRKEDLLRWKVTFDIIRRIKKEGADWLIF
ncbi:MAG: glycosyltransferase [Moraxella sp.]|nr:glycosyltransferase [Moraxella sp.]